METDEDLKLIFNGYSGSVDPPYDLFPLQSPNPWLE